MNIFNRFNRIYILISLSLLVCLNLLIMLQSDIIWAKEYNSNMIIVNTRSFSAITTAIKELDKEIKECKENEEKEAQKIIKQNFEARSIPVDYSNYQVIYDNYIYPLSKIIYAEAGNMDDTHQQYVGYVVMNRVYSKYYPNSIHDVFFSGGYADTSKERYLAEKDSDQAIKNATVVINKIFNEGLESIPVSRAMVFQAEFKQGVNIIQMGNTYFGCDERILEDMEKENSK